MMKLLEPQSTPAFTLSRLPRSLGRLALVPLLLLSLSAVAADKKAGKTDHDNFYFLSEMNKASTVMVVETKIVPPILVKNCAGRRPGDQERQPARRQTPGGLSAV
jgi:argininosuccinate lyase